VDAVSVAGSSPEGARNLWPRAMRARAAASAFLLRAGDVLRGQQALRPSRVRQLPQPAADDLVQDGRVDGVDQAAGPRLNPSDTERITAPRTAPRDSPLRSEASGDQRDVELVHGVKHASASVSTLVLRPFAGDYAMRVS
jgi:hypothetical protein